MAETIKTGTILIKEDTLKPETLRFETESCLPGWRLVKDLDGYGLDRKIRAAGWTFFCLAGEIRATVFGIDEEKMAHRAIERILTNPKLEKFNSLEITRVAPVVSKRFLGVRYVTVCAYSRHIQEGLFLFRAKDLQELVPGRIDCRPNQSIGLTRGKALPLEEMKIPKCGHDLESVTV